MNNVSALLPQHLEMVGNWGHLKPEHFDSSPNQLARATGVDIEGL